MQVQQATEGDGMLHVENVGGIDETDVEFSPGVTVLVGRNATNRTSLLQGLMAALGSERVSIKGDADEALVELTLGGETYTQRLTRRGNTVVAEGEPYLEDPELADLFAFLLRSNEARQAVASQQDLRDIIMRPIDTEDIEAEIAERRRERERIEDELAEIESLKEELPELEERRTDIEERIEDKKAELEDTEAELEAAEYDVEETQSEQAELEDKLDELQSLRGDLDDVRYELETERESLTAIEREHSDLEEEAETLPEPSAGRIDAIEREIRDLRERKRSIETEMSDLKSIIKFNEERLEEFQGDELSALEGDGASDGGAVTDQLVEDDTVRCWTCGSEVAADQIEETIDHLREVTQEKLSTVGDIDDDIDDLQAEQSELEEARRERDRVERELAGLEEEIETTRATIERLEDRKAELTEEIEAVEAEVEDRRDDRYSEILELHRKANQLEYDLGGLESDLATVEEEIADVETRIDSQDDLEAQRDEITGEIEELRTKIERLERTAIDEFNDHMDTLLDELGYENLDRIWLERVERDVKEGRRTVREEAFEIHVVRTTPSGVTYEDTVAHLSESEREVTGLVFALAGYLAHEVYDTVPFMLLDSLEAIDSDRVATLVEYLSDYTGYLLVALLPEDAEALSDDYAYLTEF